MTQLDVSEVSPAYWRITFANGPVFARRIASFDPVAVRGIKELVDVATLPSNEELGAGLRDE